MVMEGELTLGGERTMGSIDDVIQNCTPEIHVIPPTIVTPINLIIKKVLGGPAGAPHLPVTPEPRAPLVPRPHYGARGRRGDASPRVGLGHLRGPEEDEQAPALLPGFKLCHDRVFCAHDLERLDRPHWQREPHCRGAEWQHGAGLSQGRPSVPNKFLGRPHQSG